MPLFTSETAAIQGKRGAIIRWTPKPTPPEPQSLSAIVPPIADDYTARRIAVTRKQIRMMDDQLSTCSEPKDFKAICDALARLHEIERQLSGRPLPGTLKPSAPRPERRSRDFMPQPVVSCMSQQETVNDSSTPPVQSAE
jgi:hypothetical protein